MIVAIVLLIWIIRIQIKTKRELEQENELLTKSNSELLESTYKLTEKYKGL